jgi:tetratricopeptide (TPR) repeat protein
MTEEEALRLLRSGGAMERRQAADLLGQIGRSQAVEPLIHALRDEDWGVRVIAEQALWLIWCRSGDAGADALLREGMQAVEEKMWDVALAKFTQVIERAPDFAEGYNKRATTYYLMGEYEKSIADCEATIARNPVHFGALSGEGLCHLALGRFQKAREYFLRALEVNPNMPGVQQNLAALDRALRSRGNGD